MSSTTALIVLMLGVLLSGCHHARTDIPAPSMQRSTPSERESRTSAQQKIDSQLLYELYRIRGQAKQKQVPPGPTVVKIDATGRALVDVRAEVTPALEKKVRTLGGAILSTSREYRSIVGWIPLRKLERLAEDPAVYSVVPAAEATHR